MERSTERLGWWWEEERPDHPNLELGRLEEAGASLVSHTTRGCRHIVVVWSRLVAVGRVGRLTWRTIWHVGGGYGCGYGYRYWPWSGGYWPAKGGGADVGAAGDV